MMDRRSFLGAILAAGVAPAFVGSSILMPVRKLFVPPSPWPVDVDLGSGDFTAEWWTNGNLVQNVRITKGVARYSDSMTIPDPSGWTFHAVVRRVP